MGLIGLIVQSLYVGASLILMSLVSFVTHPINWLKIVSRYGISACGGANFCFAYCVEKANDEQLVKLDISKLTTCFNSSESINAPSLQQFSERFGCLWFSVSKFLPLLWHGRANAISQWRNPGVACKTLEVARHQPANNQVVFALPDQP